MGARTLLQLRGSEMSQLPRPSSADSEKGFSLMEVLVAIIVLTIGLMSGAMLMAHVYRLSVQSRYMALAAQLASEELEDLNRYPNNTNSSPPYIDPHISVPSGSTSCGISGETCVGSLTSDYGPLSFTDSSGTTSVSYFDSVSLATESGVMTETYKMACTGAPAGTGNYVTVSFSPNGVPPQWPAPCVTAAPAGMTFDRRWVIEQDQPVVGLRRITVLVTLEDTSVQLYTKAVAPGQQPPSSVVFQMSLVRP